ncbi:MAG: ABC transporter permease [Gammaproteobacteria bacterium]|nr:ABC transporter permease [Gammaproteobacteria bacterium]
MTKLHRTLGISGSIGLALMVFWLFIALFGPSLAPYPVGEIVAWEVFEPLGGAHLLGTDYLGRDVLSRILYGARFTVVLAAAAAILAGFLGTSLGVFAAVSTRWVDEVMSRFMDALISIPGKIFALVMIAAFGSSLLLLIVIVGIAYTPGCYRIARSLAVNLNQMDFVQVARARGEGRIYLAREEILPNMIHPMLTDVGLRFVWAVLLLSSLSFLGLGVQPPDADLGSLVRENISGLAEGAPAVLMPAVAIALLTVGVNLLIDSLRGKVKSAAGEV